MAGAAVTHAIGRVAPAAAGGLALSASRLCGRALPLCGAGLRSALPLRRGLQAHANPLAGGSAGACVAGARSTGGDGQGRQHGHLGRPPCGSGGAAGHQSGIGHHPAALAPLCGQGAAACSGQELAVFSREQQLIHHGAAIEAGAELLLPVGQATRIGGSAEQEPVGEINEGSWICELQGCIQIGHQAHARRKAVAAGVGVASAGRVVFDPPDGCQRFKIKTGVPVGALAGCTVVAHHRVCGAVAAVEGVALVGMGQAQGVAQLMHDRGQVATAAVGPLHQPAAVAGFGAADHGGGPAGDRISAAAAAGLLDHHCGGGRIRAALQIEVEPGVEAQQHALQGAAQPWIGAWGNKHPKLLATAEVALREERE